MCACVPNLDLYNGNTISEINSNIFAIGVVGKQLPSQSKVVTMRSEFLSCEISHVTVFTVFPRIVSALELSPKVTVNKSKFKKE